MLRIKETAKRKIGRRERLRNFLLLEGFKNREQKVFQLFFLIRFQPPVKSCRIGYLWDIPHRKESLVCLPEKGIGALKRHRCLSIPYGIQITENGREELQGVRRVSKGNLAGFQYGGRHAFGVFLLFPRFPADFIQRIPPDAGIIRKAEEKGFLLELLAPLSCRAGV